VLHSKLLAVATLLVTLLIAGCETGVAPSNPFDPEAPSATRESASITGTIYLEGRTAHGGIQVRLDGYSGNSATTTTDGSFTLANLNSGVDYMVVAEYTQEPNLEFESARIAVPSLNPGEAHSLEPATLIRAPFPPIVLDAVKSGDDAITVFWSKSEEEDVASYQVHFREGNSSFYTPHPTSCPDENSEVEGILSCEISGLLPYEQYSFKVTAIDDTGLESAYSVEDVFQFLYPDPASVMYLAEQDNQPLGLLTSADSSQAYTLTRSFAVESEKAILWQIDIENEIETGCVQFTSYAPGNGDTSSAPSNTLIDIPSESVILQQTYGAPQLMNDAEGASIVWVPYVVTYLDQPGTQFSGIASLDLSSGLPAKTAEDTCQNGAWKHTIVSYQSTIGNEALKFTLAGSENIITQTCFNVECGMYRYDIVDQRLENPEFLWEVPFELSQLAFSNETLIAISNRTNQLFLGEMSTLEASTSTTVGGPESISVIADTGYAAITGVGSNEIAIIDIDKGLDVFRLPLQVDSPTLAAVRILNEDNNTTAALYVTHQEAQALTMYAFNQPTAETPSPGHRYLTPLRCTGSCRIAVGDDPKGLTVSPDGSRVLILNIDISNRLLQLSQTSPNQ
jgi:hypothetical protein